MATPTPPRPSGENVQQALNPHRREEQQRAAAHTRDVLVQRGIRLDPGDADEALVDLLDAVESFEGAVRARGGDSFTNSPMSDDPDVPAFVVPPREPEEPARSYARRIAQAAERLRRP